MEKVKFALPKGHLEDDTLKILEQAGYVIIGGKRTYRPKINDPKIELKVLRPQEIPIFVQDGSHDIGITGQDWLLETRSDVEVLLNLEYAYVKIVLAVPEKWSNINNLSDLLVEFSKKDKQLRISTEYLNLASEYIKKNQTCQKLYKNKQPLQITPWWKKGENDKIAIYLSFGATEAKPPENADGIIEVVDTGTSISQNKLKVIEEILTSTAVLIANKKSLRNPDKREKIFDILTLLRGVIDGRKMLHIFVNVEKNNLQKLMESLPALKSPTISPLSEEGWVSINTIIEKELFLKVLPILRNLSQGLVVYEPRQVLPLRDIKSEEREEEQDEI
jgi:ATP phosphoribosyltransferase